MKTIIILGLTAVLMTGCGPMCSDTVRTNCSEPLNLSSPIPFSEYSQPMPVAQPVQVTPQTTRRTNQNYMINTPDGLKTGSCAYTSSGYLYCP